MEIIFIGLPNIFNKNNKVDLILQLYFFIDNMKWKPQGNKKENNILYAWFQRTKKIKAIVNSRLYPYQRKRIGGHYWGGAQVSPRMRRRGLGRGLMCGEDCGVGETNPEDRRVVNDLTVEQGRLNHDLGGIIA
jgi:hypothetical protein